MTPLEILSIAVFAALLVGYANRRRPRVHIPLMLAAFAVDIAMVLYIELTRGAIDQARAKMGPTMIVHITFSALCLVLYVLQIATGIKKVRRRPTRWHGAAGPALLLARLGNLITTFLVM